MSNPGRWQAVDSDPGGPRAPRPAETAPAADVDLTATDTVEPSINEARGTAGIEAVLTEDEYRRLVAAAGAAGETPDDFLRRAVRDRTLARARRLRRTEARVVYLLLFIFAATIAAGFTGLAVGWASESGMKDFLTMFVPAETALLGAASGFYFASERAPEAAEAVGAVDARPPHPPRS